MGTSFRDSNGRSATLLLAMTIGCLGSVAAAPMFVDLGGGVVLDSSTGLEWEQGPSQQTYLWAEAKSHAETLPLDGGGWRLAEVSELQELYTALKSLGGCTDNIISVDCSGDQGSFLGVSGNYWSATESEPGVRAWNVIFSTGLSDTHPEAIYEYAAWAVRGSSSQLPSSVPAPATPALVAAALLGLAVTRRLKPAACTA